MSIYVCNRINQSITTYCRTFQPRRPSLTCTNSYNCVMCALDRVLHGQNILQSVAIDWLLLQCICSSRSIRHNDRCLHCSASADFWKFFKGGQSWTNEIHYVGEAWKLNPPNCTYIDTYKCTCLHSHWFENKWCMHEMYTNQPPSPIIQPRLPPSRFCI